MGDVVYPNIPTRLPTDPDEALRAAVGKLDYVFILGWDKETGKLYAASSDSNMGRALYAFGMFEHKLFRGDFE